MNNFISDSFLSLYKDKEDLMGVLGKFVYLRTYSRYLNDLKRRELWYETCKRVVEYNVGLEERFLLKHNKTISFNELKEEAEFFYDNLFNLKTFPSGRTLYMGGTEIVDKYPLSNYNCGFMSLNSFESFEDLFYLLMVGCGIGLRITKEEVNKLPNIKEVEVEHIHNPNFRKKELKERYLNFLNGKNERNPYDEIENTVIDIIDIDTIELKVGDSKEGWVDALRYYFKIISEDTYKDIRKIIINYSYVRDAGEPLKRFGGRASGHESLLVMFKKINNITLGIKKLSTVNCLDIATIISENVVCGGVRRSSLIILCDPDDIDLINAKKDIYSIDKNGNFLIDESVGHRRMSNNSILFQSKPSIDKIKEVMESIKNNGEPGFLNGENALKRKSDFEGCNPCGEILLKSKSCCNLTTTNLVNFISSNKLDIEALKSVLRLSVRIALRMTLIDAELKEWDEVMKSDRVIGVSLTGIMDMFNLTNMTYKELGEILNTLRDVVHDEGKRYSKVLGIEAPNLMTTIKPEGSISTLPGVSSGIHFSHSPYYVRRVRISSSDPLYKAIEKDNSFPIFDEIGSPNIKVIEIPVKSYAGKTKYNVSALEQLELYKLTMENWTDHNTSITVHVREEEWENVSKWVYENFNSIVGITFLPLAEETYPLMPFEKISEDEYYRRLKDIKPINNDYLRLLESDSFEEQDIYESACTSGACPIR
ncbi:ribonucleoside-triphosphate reductase, adenosylcobalamin-dependent [Clostridioides difficile]|uniref:ribonucleoside-triphosphate reductase, adenosylcobalamin-dependent n=1 Tax=Clostridioides difficile TaxID=1496 RepID=UPI001431CDE0|nr:ribonucleoside-triphosphate reductase, adenosylcobalamin-dependent [Clostridioides difficile]MCM0739733.1 ribonucleoside-triphosphate reductase, adenosylcobalamin-dependent [Clostridioides difficile]NJA72320.1 ribonucleoside-triphosphate reductase, adenosylcobalamin-dependent [Clostridioides difficile]HBF2930471.1 ribonucleoside-triphosphate reductase, adenosylcobalamin-dependent [Clostridioides difficile]HBF2935855.1 ribonucleoside-triphosphate reductase, adenosylcobalamin-dependent [Clostr